MSGDFLSILDAVISKSLHKSKAKGSLRNYHTLFPMPHVKYQAHKQITNDYGKYRTNKH